MSYILEALFRLVYVYTLDYHIILVAVMEWTGTCTYPTSPFALQRSHLLYMTWRQSRRTKSCMYFLFSLFLDSWAAHAWSVDLMYLMFFLVFIVGWSFINFPIFILTSLDHQKELECLKRYSYLVYISLWFMLSNKIFISAGGLDIVQTRYSRIRPIQSS